MWGGYQPDIPIIHDNEEKKAMSSIIEVYHLCTVSWEQKPTIGNPPLAVRDSVIGNEIYYFGGYCNHPYCYHNSLNSLDVSTFKWQEICPTTPRDDACRPTMKGVLWHGSIAAGRGRLSCHSWRKRIAEYEG